VLKRASASKAWGRRTDIHIVKRISCLSFYFYAAINTIRTSQGAYFYKFCNPVDIDNHKKLKNISMIAAHDNVGIEKKRRPCYFGINAEDNDGFKV
jgi:hypothetical protein